MKRSDQRILTTHCGSLARPRDLLDLMRARAAGDSLPEGAFDARVRSAVTESARQQVACGLDVVNDGEQGRRGFYHYVRERLTGLEPQQTSRRQWTQEVNAFPEYYQEYFARAMTGGAVSPVPPMGCVGPVTYVGHAALQRDIANLKAALADVDHQEVFMSAVAPSGVAENRHYRNDEEYFFAMADALRHEYQAIVDAGFLLQIDDPFLTDEYSYGTEGPAETVRRAELLVAATNHALESIPREKVRFTPAMGLTRGRGCTTLRSKTCCR